MTDKLYINKGPKLVLIIDLLLIIIMVQIKIIQVIFVLKIIQVINFREIKAYMINKIKEF